jgi:hypothetical protein
VTMAMFEPSRQSRRCHPRPIRVDWGVSGLEPLTSALGSATGRHFEQDQQQCVGVALKSSDKDFAFE